MSKGFSINDIIDFDTKEKEPAGEEMKEYAPLDTPKSVELKAEVIKEPEIIKEESEALTPFQEYILLEDEAGDKKSFETFPVIIGRAEDSSLVVSDSLVSRNHAKITKEGDKYFLEDMSTAGTYLAVMRDGKAAVLKLGEDVARKTEIKDGQIIQFATKIYIFRVQRYA